MNQKQIKKLRKYAKQRVDENVGQGLEALSKVVRDRPKWIPKRIWILAYIPLFKWRDCKVIYKTIK